MADIHDVIRAVSKGGEKKKGSRKQGRITKSAAHGRYNNEHRDQKNKVRKMRRHLKEHPNDMQTLKLLCVETNASVPEVTAVPKQMKVKHGTKRHKSAAKRVAARRELERAKQAKEKKKQ